MPFTVFGFGSLVNRHTLSGVLSARTGTVRGWRRAWRAPGHMAGGVGVCSLSVIPADDAIEGLFVTFADDERTRLAARERNYDAVPLEGEGGAVIYRAKPEVERWGDAASPVSLSYLDTILGGYLDEFGEAGAERFMATTDGWFVPILDDRAAPRYPRAVALSPQAYRMIDRLVEMVDATVTKPSDNPAA
ncbi:MAG: gamma-glutamylcyclotransferase family protein [Pseudomonadota bacterium]